LNKTLEVRNKRESYGERERGERGECEREAKEKGGDREGGGGGRGQTEKQPLKTGGIPAAAAAATAVQPLRRNRNFP